VIGQRRRYVELTKSDAVAIADLFVRCADYFLLQDGVMPGLADAIALFSDVPPTKVEGDQVILGWRDDKGLYAVAAVLRDYPGDGIWYLGLLLIDPGHRGHGFGRTLYGEIDTWTTTHGAREMRLAVLEANGPGECYWRALGFEELRRVGPDPFKKKRHCRVELGRSMAGRFADLTSPR